MDRDLDGLQSRFATTLTWCNLDEVATLMTWHDIYMVQPQHGATSRWSDLKVERPKVALPQGGATFTYRNLDPDGPQPQWAAMSLGRNLDRPQP